MAKKRGDVFVNMENIRSRADAHGRYNHPGDLGMRRLADLILSGFDGKRNGP